MSLNVADGHFEYVIWSNEYLDWANWQEAFEEDYSDASEDKKYELMSELNSEYLDDERMNMDVRVGTPIIIIADIGKWDGRHTGYREIESGCLKDCLYTELDGVTWYVDDKGDFRMDGYHHDGHNYYLYRKYKEGVSFEEREDFQCRILDHTLTEADIERVTERLGDDIAKIYGFTLPDQKRMKERGVKRDER